MGTGYGGHHLGKVRLALLAASSSSVLACWGAPAAAQDQNRADNKIEEIVVTAQRREERLQDVPVAVTALSEQQLQSRQVMDVIALSHVAPSMTIAQGITANDLKIGIRGQTIAITTNTGDPAIGVYVDGVYYRLTAGSNLAMIDMERAEVLKGPQGTLFGRNTIGGALNIITNKPRDTFEGSVTAALGNLGAQTYTAILNAPLVTDKLAARIVYQFSKDDGYGESLTLDQDLNSIEEQHYVRASVKLDATENTDILVTASYSNTDGGGSILKLSYVNPALPFNALIPLLSGRPGDLLSNYAVGDPYNTFSNTSANYSLETKSLTGTVTHRMGDATLRSITNYSRVRFNSPQDFDGTPYAVIDFDDFPLWSNAFSEEIQLFGDSFNQRLNWMVGLYYFWDEGAQGTDLAALLPLTRSVARSNTSTENKSYAAFAQLTYEIAPGLRLTGGLRYAKDKRKASWIDQTVTFQPRGTFLACQLANAPAATAAQACFLAKEASFDYFPWTVGLDYKPNDDVLIYGKVSKGYRSGAFPYSGPRPFPNNPVANAASLAVFGAAGPENLLSPEIGTKFSLLDNRLRIAAAVYYSRYKSIQLISNERAPDGSNINVLRNVGSADLYGGELEVTAQLKALRLDAAVGLVDAEYKSGPLVGFPFSNVSKINWSLAASYPVETGLGLLTFNADYLWRSRVYFATPRGPAQAVAQRQDGFGLLNGRVTLDLRSAPVTIAVYGTNLTDKYYKQGSNDFDAAFGITAVIPGRPRTYGASIQYRF